MATTPDQISLVGVSEEQAAVEDHMRGRIEVKIRKQPTAAEILKAMPSHSIFHFAGHGSSNAADVSRSWLIFERLDEKSQRQILDELSVRQLFDLEMQPASLALLSACSTADDPDQNLQDKNVYLADGFLVAGFNNVVASLWPVDDRTCVELVAEFYEQLDLGEEKTLTCRDIATALHHAVRALYRSNRGTPLLWAPYIHLGA